MVWSTDGVDAGLAAEEQRRGGGGCECGPVAAAMAATCCFLFFVGLWLLFVAGCCRPSRVFGRQERGGGGLPHGPPTRGVPPRHIRGGLRGLGQESGGGKVAPASISRSPLSGRERRRASTWPPATAGKAHPTPPRGGRRPQGRGAVAVLRMALPLVACKKNKRQTPTPQPPRCGGKRATTQLAQRRRRCVASAAVGGHRQRGAIVHASRRRGVALGVLDKARH